MCVGIPALIAIASSAVSFMGAQQQAAAQNAFAESNRNAAIAAANDRYTSLNIKTVQEAEAASQKLFQTRIEALKAKSTARVASGEGGVSGLSVNALMGDLEAQHAREEQAIDTNFSYQRFGNISEAEATYHQTVGRINSVRQAAGPSPLAFALQAAGGALNATAQQKAGNYQDLFGTGAGLQYAAS